MTESFRRPAAFQVDDPRVVVAEQQLVLSESSEQADQNSVPQRQCRERLAIASAIRLSVATNACSELSDSTSCCSATTTRGSST